MFVPGSLMFASKDRAYLSEAPLRLPALTSVKRPSRDKHSSLLQEFANYGRKKFPKIGPWTEVKLTVFLSNLG
jgi:hypothetical protein